MRNPLRMRTLTEEEERVIKKLARSPTASARLVERAQIIELAAQGQTIPQIMQQLLLSEPTVRKWWKRFESMGISGLEDSERLGAPPRFSAEQKAKVLVAERPVPTTQTDDELEADDPSAEPAEKKPDEIKYRFSTLPPETSLERLVLLAHARWVIEQFYEDAKQECGLDHFQGRSWEGLHRHLALVLLAYSFLMFYRLTLPSAP